MPRLLISLVHKSILEDFLSPSSMTERKRKASEVQEMKTNKHVLPNQISRAGFSQRAEN